LKTERASTRPPAEVFQCVTTEVPALGFTQASIDTEARRVTARKYDWDTRVADSTFRRMVERLSIEVRPSGANGATLVVEARTFAEHVTQRGPTETEREASAAVKEAAQKLTESCGG
jgi:hypothetical protein